MLLDQRSERLRSGCYGASDFLAVLLPGVTSYANVALSGWRLWVVRYEAG